MPKNQKGIPGHGFTGDAMGIEILAGLTNALLRYAAETQLPVGVIVENAVISFLERKENYG